MSFFQAEDYPNHLYMNNLPNQVGSIMRNPENNSYGSIKIVPEFDVHGRIRMVHSFLQDGNKKHREYSFTRIQLKEFLRQNQNIAIQFDENVHDNHYCVENVDNVGQYQPSTFNHLEYRVSDLPLPRSSFEASFQHKHEPSMDGRMSQPNVPNKLPTSNISGNEIDYAISMPSNIGQ